jgi:hypothetical protein
MRSIGSKGSRPQAAKDAWLNHSAAFRGDPSPASRVPLPTMWGGKSLLSPAITYADAGIVQGLVAA